MPDPCLNPAPEIDLTITDSPSVGGLKATLVPSGDAGNGLETLGDGAYAPGYDDMVGGGFPTIPGSPPGTILAKTAPDLNVSWTFRYNPLSTSTHPWEYIGGAALYADVEAQGNITTGAGSVTSFSAWVDLFGTRGSRGPDLDIPFDGQYLCEFGCAVNGPGGNNVQGQIGIDTVAGGSPAGNDTASGGSSGWTSCMRAQLKTFAGGDTVRCYYRGSLGTNAFLFERAWLKITPIRCSGGRGSSYGGT